MPLAWRNKPGESEPCLMLTPGRFCPRAVSPRAGLTLVLGMALYIVVPVRLWDEDTVSPCTGQRLTEHVENGARGRKCVEIPSSAPVFPPSVHLFRQPEFGSRVSVAVGHLGLSQVLLLFASFLLLVPQFPQPLAGSCCDCFLWWRSQSNCPDLQGP